MQEEDWTSDSRIEAAASVRKLVAPNDLLSADRVAAVRFQIAKPGYTFAQVEAFVDQVRRSLEYLEAAEHAHQLAVHEATEEMNEMQDRISTLQATVEIFRAKGDVLVDASGNLVTESARRQAGKDTGEVAALRAENERLKAEQATLHTMLERVSEERDLATADAAALRTYIDDELMPWANALAASANASAETGTVTADPAVPAVDPAAGPQYVTDVAEIVSMPAPHVNPDLAMEPPVFNVTPAPVQVVTTVGPLLEHMPPPLVVSPSAEGLDELPPPNAEQVIAPASGRKRRDRRQVLVSAPELEGLQPDLLPDSDDLPAAPSAGAPLPGVHRNRPPLTDAPELAMGPEPRD